jgi:hypothetical protein
MERVTELLLRLLSVYEETTRSSASSPAPRSETQSSNVTEECCISDQITSPQPLRLEHQSEQPLETHSPDQSGGTRESPRREI